IARGVQNKVLEAMAMARPVVTSHTCAQAVEAELDRDFMAATEPAEYVAAISKLLMNRNLAEEMGRAGRAQVLARYSWDAHLAKIDAHLVSASR
ncbi:MAG TPA: glycosyltransferase, partial [Rhodocyclaceae bacterium]|nr:glycosyltransferase [Rhodocyclaceae bacterium]